MHTVAVIRDIPANFGVFIDEIAAGVTNLYGSAAGQEYRRHAPKTIAETMRHGQVTVLAAEGSSGAAALLFAIDRGQAGQFTFVHVLHAYQGRGLEGRLLEEAVRRFRAQDAHAIVGECLPFCRVDWEDRFAALGFEAIPRVLMIAALDAPELGCTESNRSVAADHASSAALATVFAAAYRHHPERRLHTDMRDAAGAEAFVRNTLDGGFGAVASGYSRMICEDDEPVAVALGCKVAPGVGFVLQVAVRPDRQGRGLGRQVLRETAAAFREAGMERIALGVTRSNPAHRLYGRLGFRQLRPVTAYAWWRPGITV